MAGLSDILETTQLEKVAGGFVFTEGPLWHPDDFWYFVDIRQNLLYRMVLGQKAAHFSVFSQSNVLKHQ